MTYEKGSYTRELRTEHEAGAHHESPHPQCIRCSIAGDPDPGTWHDFVLAAALRDEKILDEHARGEHRENPHPSCQNLECVNHPHTTD